MILVINSGSSNTKFAIFKDDSLETVYHSKVKDIDELLLWYKENKNEYNITSVGHRIVHGGTEFNKPVIITEKIIKKLKDLIPLAPLHQGHNIKPIEAFRQEDNDLLQVACFDTAFHHTQTKLAKTFAIPSELTKQGIVKYGFHGLSYEYITSMLEKHIGLVATKRVIIAHLGNGASMCAINNLQSVATSMGFSTLDGLMMGTRCGNIDPGVLLYLMQSKGYSTDKLSHLLYYDSGLKGVSGISNDISVLEQNYNPDAKFALDLFAYRAACELSKLAVSLGGIDALVFTGGIGENSSTMREKICDQLTMFNIFIDSKANSRNDKKISRSDSSVGIFIIKTNEEYMIAQHVFAIKKSS